MEVLQVRQWPIRQPKYQRSCAAVVYLVGAGLMPSFYELSEALVGSKRQSLLNGSVRAMFNEDTQVIQHGSLRLWSTCCMETETSLYWVKCYFNIQT